MTESNPEVPWAKSRHGRTQYQSLQMLKLFCKFTGKTPHQLLDLQEEAMLSKNLDARYLVVNMIHDWIDSVKGRKSTKQNYISTIRSFFSFHHRPLPDDEQWVRSLKSDREKVEGQVTPEMLHIILDACHGNYRAKSMILTQLQSFSGPRELCIIGNTMGLKIAKELKEGANLIELHFPTGRKHSDKEWYTYIGKDACNALREWFNQRGYPDQEIPFIWPSQKPQQTNTGKTYPLTESGVSQVFTRIAARLGLRPQLGAGEGTYTRYGVSVGQIRDLALSLAQKAKSAPANDHEESFLDSSADYFAGHSIDPLGYRKLHKLDVEYRKRQYELVEPYVSPISGVTLDHEKTRELEAKNKELEARLERLEAISVERLTLAKTLSHKKRRND